jgi:hypothetical protein
MSVTYTAAAECYLTMWLAFREEQTMSTDKIDPSKKDATISSSADDLVQATKSGDVELTEEQLNRVAGGRKAGQGQQEFLVIKMNDLIVTG